MTVTGEQLHEELRIAAVAAGMSIHKFTRPLFSEPNWKLEQLRIAKHPTQLTIDRVRALVAGRPIPPSRGQYIRDPRAVGLSRAEAEEAGIPPRGPLHFTAPSAKGSSEPITRFPEAGK